MMLKLSMLAMLQELPPPSQIFIQTANFEITTKMNLKTSSNYISLLAVL